MRQTNSSLPETSSLQQPPEIYDQLWLQLYAKVDPDKVPPDRGLWRELLSLSGASGPVHHVCWILYGRMDRQGRVKAKAQTLADDGGLGVRTVHRSLTEAKRIGAVRWQRKRGASWYELNLGGGFTKKRQNCLTGRSRTASQADLLKDVGSTYRASSSSKVAAVHPDEARTDGQQQLMRRATDRSDGLFAACAVRARKLGLKYDEADERKRFKSGDTNLGKLQTLADRLATRSSGVGQLAADDFTALFHHSSRQQQERTPTRKPTMPELADIREIFEIHTNISPVVCPVCPEKLSITGTGNCIDGAINHVLQHDWRLLHVGSEWAEDSDGSQSVTRWRSSENQLHRWVCGRVYRTALIGLTRRRPAVFSKHFKPFARAGLSLTGIAVGVSRFSTGRK